MVVGFYCAGDYSSSISIDSDMTEINSTKHRLTYQYPHSPTIRPHVRMVYYAPMTDPTTEKTFRPKHMTLEEIRDGCITISNGDSLETRVCIAQEELRQGIEAVTRYPKSVTMYGSARIHEAHHDYETARRIARRAVQECGYAVITGGGPGIMEAANRGASEVGGVSIGLTIRLPHEQHTNPYVNVEVPFYFFFTRKTSLSFASEVYLFFPGGFGTFDEIFEILTLVQTNKIPRIPLVLVGKHFWLPFVEVIQRIMLESEGTISENDMSLLHVTDDEDEIIAIIKEAKERNTAIDSDPTILGTPFAE
jgi:uncharacterized protein (TIGR00730 family)